MFELTQEKILMYSDDRSVTLTTHRIIHQTDKDKHQIMLEDFENYQFKRSHIGNYKLLTIIFTAISLIFIVLRINEYFDSKQLTPAIKIDFSDFFWASFFVILGLFFLLLSLLFFLISRRYFVRINGRFNSIEIRVRSLNKKSLKHFLQTLVLQSEKIKKAISQKDQLV